MYAVSFQKEPTGPVFRLVGYLSAVKANTKVKELEAKGFFAQKQYAGK